MVKEISADLPLGWIKTPFSTPPFNARLNRESNMESVALIVLLALTYFFRLWRLFEHVSVVL